MSDKFQNADHQTATNLLNTQHHHVEGQPLLP